MKNKSWPVGIVIVYIIFMAGILFMVNTAVSTNFKSADENYHIEDLTSEQKIEYKHNTIKDSTELVYTFYSDSIKVQFPSSIKNFTNIIGQFTFFRPSDESRDKHYELKLSNDGTFVKSTKELINGFWRIQISWEINRKHYYSESSFTKGDE